MAGAWVKLIWNSLGVSAVAAAAQLAVAQALGIVRWDATYPADNSTGWSALLTWIAFIFAVAVLGGAAVGRRAVRKPTKPDGIAARITAALAAGVGAGVAVSLAWLPAESAKPPVSVHPELLVALTAGTAIVAGIVIALVALSVPPVAGGVRAAVAWIWLVGVGSAVAGYVTHRPYDPPRLAVVDAPSIVPAAWWSGPYLMVVFAAILGVAVAYVARWGGARRLGIAFSGFVGPAVVAAAYLIAGSGNRSEQLDPYRAALISVAVGLIASIVVAIPAPRERPGSSSAIKRRQRYGELEAETMTAPGHPEPRTRQPLLDEADEPEEYPQEPGPPIANPLPPAYAHARATATVTAPAQPTAVMGQPPSRTYEEDYSEWLRDLGHVPGQRTDPDREDQRL